MKTLISLLACLVVSQAAGQTLVIANAHAFPLVVQWASDVGTVEYIVPALDSRSFAVPAGAACSVTLLRADTGAGVVGLTALGKVWAGSLVTVSDYTAFAAPVVSWGSHVENPTQGMEFLIFAAGFICAAICWRFVLGRW